MSSVGGNHFWSEAQPLNQIWIPEKCNKPWWPPSEWKYCYYVWWWHIFSAMLNSLNKICFGNDNRNIEEIKPSIASSVQNRTSSSQKRSMNEWTWELTPQQTEWGKENIWTNKQMREEWEKGVTRGKKWEWGNEIASEGENLRIKRKKQEKERMNEWQNAAT